MKPYRMRRPHKGKKFKALGRAVKAYAKYQKLPAGYCLVIEIHRIGNRYMGNLSTSETIFTARKEDHDDYRS